MAYDQRGHGWSDSGPVSVAAFAEDLAAVISALQLTNPVLYGGSFGTLVCLGYFLEGGEAMEDTVGAADAVAEFVQGL